MEQDFREEWQDVADRLLLLLREYETLENTVSIGRWTSDMVGIYPLRIGTINSHVIKAMAEEFRYCFLATVAGQTELVIGD